MKNKLKNKVYPFLILGKLNIMIPVSLTGFTGYFIYDSRFSIHLILVTIGILLLAVSASVLNQYQESEIDSRMKRTMNRPIPAGKIKPHTAIVFFLFVFVTGSGLLYFAGNFLSLLIGFLTIFWYNGVYTYTKRITAFAVIPGAITGALPPLIGWLAAGGGVFDKPVLFLMFLFFIGQVPHFWLLMLKYGEEYKAAGFPTLTGIFSTRQINRMTFSWVITSVAAGLFLCYFEIIQAKILARILLVLSIVLIGLFLNLLKTTFKSNDYRKYSILLNSYFLIILLLLISDRII
jgi:heme o synthase